jgi:ribonuclease VapC
MIVDTSAILAVLFHEAEHERLIDKLLRVENKGVGAPTLVEVSLVLTGRLGPSQGMVDRFVQEFGVTIIPFEEAHWRTAADAFLRFGKGRHPAALNLGDCQSYAVAKLAQQPLLFIGNDFSQTDLIAA